MMPDNAEVFRKVMQRLYKMAAPQYLAITITEETETYWDPGIYGEKIFDLFWWLEKEFGVKN
jgi:hypothetical protein